MEHRRIRHGRIPDGSPGRGRRRWVPVSVAALAVGAILFSACSSANGASIAGGRLRVVAAENFWGSLASQLGGDKVQVTSVITNPDTDPHDYEPTAADARLIANAQLVIENGIGYDPWVSRLVAANPAGSRKVVTVGDVVGIAPGGNPHQWYSPASVDLVIAAITAQYKLVDPADASFFDGQRVNVQSVALKAYHDALDQIHSKYAGVPVGASESIFTPMASALGLHLLTPRSFLDAISEGTDPSPADRATVEGQIQTHGIKVFVYNSQNTTPDVQRLVDQARAAGIPVTDITETLAPASASFQDWQVRELRNLEAALAQAMPR
jgi:zinc/manganese transport system substrate-binding protein